MRVSLVLITLLMPSYVRSLTMSDIIRTENIGRLRVERTGPYGGDGGEWFTDWWESLDGTKYQPIHPPQQINIRAGGRVDSIQLLYGGYHGERHGGEGGALHRLRLYEGDRIVRVRGRRGLGPGAGVDQITFYTLNGRVLGPYGGTGGVEFDSGNFTSKSCYLGYISGKAGLRLDQLTLHWSCPWGDPEFDILQPPMQISDRNSAQLLLVGFKSIVILTLLSVCL